MATIWAGAAPDFVGRRAGAGQGHGVKWLALSVAKLTSVT
jgi:hypothetical protein